MNCPVCPGVSLVMADRSGVEIDYCPKCRGVWLDRGELDKIVERMSGDSGASGRGVTGPIGRTDAPPPGYDPKADSKAGYPYRRKSAWRELFDF